MHFSNSYDQVRTVFGSTRHVPHSVFVRVSKRNKSGKESQFFKLAECHMGGEALQLLLVLHLKDTLVECVASNVFSEVKAFQYIGCILKKDESCDLLFAACQALL